MITMPIWLLVCLLAGAASLAACLSLFWAGLLAAGKQRDGRDGERDERGPSKRKEGRADDEMPG